jgi:phosphoserine phosphatase
VTEVTVSAGTWPLVTVDIDGTLTTVHGWKVIADSLGRPEELSRSNRRFFAKEIGEDEHLKDLLEIASGRPLSEVEAALDSTPRIGGIAEGIRAFHAQGSRVALLTHNPPYVCEWYCRRFGFDDFEGTAAQAVTAGVIQPPLDVRADKPRGLRALAARSGVPPHRIVHIGDGWADAALFSVVGRGVALNSSRPEVDSVADLVLRASDFREVADAVGRLRPRQ